MHGRSRMTVDPLQCLEGARRVFTDQVEGGGRVDVSSVCLRTSRRCVDPGLCSDLTLVEGG